MKTRLPAFAIFHKIFVYHIRPSTPYLAKRAPTTSRAAIRPHSLPPSVTLLPYVVSPICYSSRSQPASPASQPSQSIACLPLPQLLFPQCLFRPVSRPHTPVATAAARLRTSSPVAASRHLCSNRCTARKPPRPRRAMTRSTQMSTSAVTPIATMLQCTCTTIRLTTATNGLL